MIRTITMRGLGPSDDSTTAIAGRPADWVDVHGPSKAGKSSLMLATTFALWGEEPDGTRLGLDAIRDGADRAEVEVELLNGLRVGRSITPSRSVRRRVERAGSPEVFPKSDRDMLAQLGPLGVDHDLARLVMMPLSWVPLALGEGGGRPLRDALARILPAAPISEVVADLMTEKGQTLRESDPVDEPGAITLRADANRASARRRGEVEALESAVVRAEERAQTARGPGAAQVAAARATLDTARAWTRYETLGAEAGAYEQEVAARDAWRRRKAARGDRPDDNDAEIGRTSDWRQLCRATVADRGREVAAARRALDRAAVTLAAAEAAPLDVEAPAVVAAREAHAAAGDATEATAEVLAKVRAAEPLGFPAVVASRADLNGAALALDRATIAAAEPSPTGPCSHCGSDEWPNAETRAAHLADDLDAATRDHAEAEANHAAAIAGARALHAEDVAGLEQGHASAIAEQDAAALVVSDALADATTAAEAAHTAAVEAAGVAVEQARAGIQRAEEDEVAAAGVLERAEADRDAAVKAGSAAREWDAAARALGREPAVRPAPQGAADAPTTPKPPPVETAAARAVLAEAEQAKGAASARVDNVGELRTDLDSARERQEAAVVEAARAGVLLDCVRAAPSEAVRASIEGLDAGRVTLHLEGSGVKVQIDGRRWQRASDGERIIADLEFRAALRRALVLGGKAATWLPLFVDRAQDVRGIPWPDVPGPVIRLWTSDGDMRAEVVGS